MILYFVRLGGLKKYPRSLKEGVIVVQKDMIRVTKRAGGGMEEQHAEAEVPWDEFKCKLFGFLLGCCKNPSSEWWNLPSEFYGKFNLHLSNEHDRLYCSPSIEAAFADEWIVLRGDLHIGQWMFLRRLAQAPWFEEVSLPEELKLESDGTLRSNDHVFPPFQYPWPFVVGDPKRFAILGRLHQMLEATEENPLSILLRSPQPYKGLAKQVVKRIEEIINSMK